MRVPRPQSGRHEMTLRRCNIQGQGASTGTLSQHRRHQQRHGCTPTAPAHTWAGQGVQARAGEQVPCPPPRPRAVQGRATPSPAPDLPLTFQVLFLAQEAADGCHGDSLWVAAKGAAASSQPPQPAPAPRGPAPAREGVWGPQQGQRAGPRVCSPPQDTPGGGQHSQGNHRKTAGGPPHSRDSGCWAPSPQLTKGARLSVWARSPGRVERGRALASATHADAR